MDFPKGILVQIPDDEVPLAAVPESPYVRQVVNLVNEERVKAGLLPLEKTDDVSAAAAVRAQELVSSFSHTRPDGSAYRTVLEQQGIVFAAAEKMWLMDTRRRKR